MKNKYWVLIIAALTVIGTFWTQTELGGKKYRTHQHKEYLSVEDTIPDVQEAINAEQISESQYNSEAVDIEKLKTHLPVVKIETSEEIPGVPYYEEGYSHRKYTTTSEGEGVNDEKQENTQFDLFPSSGGGAGGCAAVYR